MLRNTKDLDNFAIRATDGEIGQIKDLYFDDDAWAVRYFVVEAGSWLSSRKVLVSPVSAQQPDWHGKTLPVSISKARISGSPDIDTDKPVSRQNEEQYLGYYGYAPYWGGQGLWGEGMYPFGVVPTYVANGPDWVERQREDQAALAAERARHRNDDPHLRICAAVQRSTATTCRPRMARSAMSAAFWWTNSPGPSATWWWIPAIGGWATRC
jgi:hypothetical protein